MRPIGGFFELELGRRRRPMHGDAVALSSGRACFNAIVEQIRPDKMYVPFFVCNAVLEPLIANGIPFEYYPLDEDLEPTLAVRPADNEYLLYVDYFGLKAAASRRLVETSGTAIIVDASQAFFAPGRPDAWSFNSARKFFGVPDGGYLYGPLSVRDGYPQRDDIPYEHLINRWLGRTEEAWRQYQASEKLVGIEPRAMSRLSAHLLATIDYEAVRMARVRNFETVHERLGHLNDLSLALCPLEDQVPFCYPFLPGSRARREQLWERSLFVPMLWPDVTDRTGQDFAWERDLASRLLPLPIDQRYELHEIERLCDGVLDILS